MTQPWFSMEAARWLTYLSLFSVLAGLEQFVRRGQHRRPVLAILAICAVLGALLLSVGVAASLSGQPGFVRMPFLLSGGIMAAVFGIVRGISRRRYTVTEMRRISAGDL
jgi:peptidoglycan/LPS O-acetylase OafA/YrhL